ncbi:helix-turn-helix domain-containing protein [Acidisarcina polymorpha]|uniref:helix-turn-helix domain-containing protein n=1 Tax=Acidisarcina polymorpha TaxID=2211140 RepID=UPI0039C874F5
METGTLAKVSNEASLYSCCTLVPIVTFVLHTRSISTRPTRVKEESFVKYQREAEITAVEAARRLGVGLDYVYSLLWTGKLQGRKIGKRWIVPARVVQARLKKLTGGSSDRSRS